MVAACLTLADAASALAFDHAAFAAGQWWRTLTYPWPHASLYHLLCDGIAFAALWVMLGGNGWRGRWGCLAAGMAGALLWPLLWPSPIRSLGLCGLSGPAHGLMIGLCMQQSQDARRQGQHLTSAIAAGGLALVLAKSVWETWTGSVVLASWHLGDLGVPIAACHLGGALGGLIWAAATARIPMATSTPRPDARAMGHKNFRHTRLAPALNGFSALFLGSRDKKTRSFTPLIPSLSAGAPRKRAKETSPYLGFVCATRGVSPTR